MDNDAADIKPSSMRIGWTARIVALLWGGFWVWFGLASGIAEGAGFIGTIRHTLTPGLILLASALFAWKYEKIGGGLLIVEGLIIAIAYPLLFGSRFPFSTVFFVLLTMAVPPLAAGILFVVNFRRGVNPSRPQGS